MRTFVLFILLYCSVKTLAQTCECASDNQNRFEFPDTYTERISKTFILCAGKDNKILKSGIYRDGSKFIIIYCPTNKAINYDASRLGQRVHVENDVLYIEKPFPYAPSLQLASEKDFRKPLKMIYRYESEKKLTKTVQNGEFQEITAKKAQDLVSHFYEDLRELNTNTNSTFDFGAHITNLLVSALNYNLEAKKIIMNLKEYLKNPRGTIRNDLARELVIVDVQDFLSEYDGSGHLTN